LAPRRSAWELQPPPAMPPLGTPAREERRAPEVAPVPRSSGGQPKAAEGLAPRRCVGLPKAAEGLAPRRCEGQPKAAEGLAPRRSKGQPKAAEGLAPRRCEGLPKAAEGLAPRRCEGQPKAAEGVAPRWTCRRSSRCGSCTCSRASVGGGAAARQESQWRPPSRSGHLSLASQELQRDRVHSGGRQAARRA
jgi:hypothetical protein